MIPLLASLVVPVLTGLAFVYSFWPKPQRRRSHHLMAVSLAVGIGFGLSSCSFFLASLVFGVSRAGLILAEVSLLACFTVCFFAMKQRYCSLVSDICFDTISEPPAYRPLLSLCFYVTLACALAGFMAVSLHSPHGGWDAWMIWNMRARFMLRAGDHWLDAFSNLLPLSHPDYPLLLQGLVVRGWLYLANETVLVPILLALVFTLLTVALISSGLSVLRTRSQGLLAGLILLSTQSFITHGASQYADVPLGFFFLATLVLLCLHDRLTMHYGLMFLAGVTAGLASWTKNEGLLFLLLVCTARCVIAVRIHGWKAWLSETGVFALGLSPMLIIVVYFKTQLAPPNDLISALGFGEVLGRLLDYEGYVAVLVGFKDKIASFGYNGLMGAVWLLITYLICVGIRLEARDKLWSAVSATALCSIVAAYAAIYLFASYDVPRHVNSSLDRLLLQLWPSFLFTYFMIAATPEEAAA